MRISWLALLSVALLLIAPSISAQISLKATPLNQMVTANLASQPLCFTENRGQWGEKTLFKAEADGAIFYFCQDEVAYLFIRDTDELEEETYPEMAKVPEEFVQPQYKKEALLIKAQFVNANPNPMVIGEGRLPYNCNYFYGSDQAKWRTDVPNFTAITYKDIWPGIDLCYHGNGQGMKYDFVLSPGADLSQIQVRYDGVNNLAINSNGTLQVDTRFGIITENIPAVYQETNGGQRDISGRYVMKGQSIFGFEVEGYDSIDPLIIDPELLYSSYLGGINSDVACDIVVDNSYSIYITGRTYSPDIPIVNPYDGIYNGSEDVFIAKFAPSGNSLVYCTFLGGNWMEAGASLFVNRNEELYICGSTNSQNFPLTNPVIGHMGVFVTKLSSAGNELLYSTTFGGNQGAGSTDMTVDSLGYVYITGSTSSSDFPVLNAVDSSFNGGVDCFVTVLSPDGSSLIYSTFYGGSLHDIGCSIALDSQGNICIVGDTKSLDFPTVRPLFGNHNNDEFDAFVAKLSPIAEGPDSIIFSTYIGGLGADYGRSIIIGENSNIYVSGSTTASNYPTTQGAYSTINSGSRDIYLTILSPLGDSILYSTYLGGASSDGGIADAIDEDGNVYFLISTSSGFPMVRAIDGSPNGNQDAAIAILAPSTGGQGSLLFSTYIGGRDSDGAGAMTIDNTHCIYLAGETYSDNFPTINAFDSTYNYRGDAFVARIWADSVDLEPGSIWGNVLDSMANPIENAIITLNSVGAYMLDSTDANGKFIFSSLSPHWTCDLAFSHPDYYDSLINGVIVLENDTSLVDITLHRRPFTDVGISAIMGPSDSVMVNSMIPLALEVRNFGTDIQSFNIFFEIYLLNAPLAVQAETLMIAGMPENQIDTVQLSSRFQPLIDTTYKMIAYSLLSGDEHSANDTAYLFTTSYFTGAIRGFVSDTSLNPLVGAYIEILGTGMIDSCGQNGGYLLNSIVPGSYDILFSHLGFQDSVVYQATIIPRDTLSLDIILRRALITHPAQNEIGVPAFNNITVSFFKDMNHATINDSTFIVIGTLTGLHYGTIVYNSLTRTATFDPYEDFNAGEFVAVVLTDGIRALDGDSILHGYSWSFKIKTNRNDGSLALGSICPIPYESWLICAADFNNDNYIDIAVAYYYGQGFSVFLNQGNASFILDSTYAVGSRPKGILASDLNRDGNIDLAILDDGCNKIEIMYNTGNGKFAFHAFSPTIINPGRFICADLNSDGYSDLAAIGDGSLRMAIFLNDGGGNFYDSLYYNPDETPNSLGCADVDSDGDIDLLEAFYQSDYLSILTNSGDGTFNMNSNYGVNDQPTNLYSGDLNGDGYVDIGTANTLYFDASILYNICDGRFPLRSDYRFSFNYIASALGDIDGDNDLDLFATNGGTEGGVAVMMNQGDGEFSAAHDYQLGRVYALSLADFDNDGDLDVVAVQDMPEKLTVLLTNSTGGAISGIVMDAATQSPLEGVLVRALQGGSEINRDTTDSNGFYTIGNLIPGTYDLAFMRFGYQDTTITGIVVVSDSTAVVDMHLNRLSGTWIVDADGNEGIDCDCASIQPCLDLAAKNDTVYVKGHIYSEYIFSVNRGLHLIGDSAGSVPIIMSDPYFSNPALLISAPGDTVVIENFAIKGVFEPHDSAIVAWDVGLLDLHKNSILGGITVWNGAFICRENIIVAMHDAINTYGPYADVMYNDITGSNPITQYSNPDTLLGYIMQVNANGDSCDFYHNIFLDPLLADTAALDFRLTAGSPCIDAGDPASPYDPDGTIADIGAYYFDQNLASSLVAYYPFSGNANDESGNGNDGIVINATPASDRFDNLNSAYQFNGTNSLIRIFNNGTLFPPEQTVSVWVKLDYLTNSFEKILCTEDHDVWNGYQLFTHVDNSVRYQDYDGSNYNCIMNYPNSLLNTTDWFHFAISRGQNEARLFVNAIEVDSELNLTPYALSIGNILDIGGDAIHNIEFIHAKIDDIRIYNYAMSSNEIQALFHEGGWPPALPAPVFSNAINYPAGNGASSVFADDLNGDGDPDLAVTNSGSNNVSIFANNGEGTFNLLNNYSVGNNPVRVTVGDFNGDNIGDVAVVNYLSDSVSVLINYGDGTFHPTVSYWPGSKPVSVWSNDLDSDGDNDLSVANEYSNDISVLKNCGDGTFLPAISYNSGGHPYSHSVADFDGDGDVDIAVANHTDNNVSVLKNNGDGAFLAPVIYGVGDGPLSISVGDLDADGDNDIVVTNEFSDFVSILENNGDGSFQSAANYYVGAAHHGISVSDLNEDGHNDLAIASYAEDATTVLLNNGDGAFGSPITFGVGAGPLFVYACDLDTDGDNDLAVANYGSNNVSILLNQCYQPPHENILIRPASNISVAASIRFVWSDISDSAYTILISNSTQLSDTVMAATTLDSFYVYGGSTLTHFSSYYWSVKANWPPDQPYASPRSFMFIPDTVQLWHPVPGDAVEGNPTFYWSRLPGVAQYRLKLSTDLELQNVIWQTNVSNDTMVTYSPYIPLVDGTQYFWSVSALIDGTWRRYPCAINFLKSPSSDTLCAPIPLNPEPGDSIAFPTVFSWDDTCGSHLYNMFIFADSSLVSDTLWLAPTTTQQITIPPSISGLQDSTGYFWSVQGHSQSGIPSYFSSLRSFVLMPTVEPPETPLLESPVQGDSVFGDSIAFTWQPSEGADYYELQYSISPNFPDSFGQTWTASSITGTQYIISPNGVGAIFWRVRAYNSAGWSAYSGTGDFTYGGSGGGEIPGPGPGDPPGSGQPGNPPACSNCITQIDLYSPAHNSTVPVGQSLNARARFIGSYIGNVQGEWLLNGTVLSTFNEQMNSGGHEIISPNLPTVEPHSDTIQVHVTFPEPAQSCRYSYAIYYSVVPSTFGLPYMLSITCNPSSIEADNGESATVTVSVLDDQGRLVTNDNGRTITLSLYGEGVLDNLVPTTLAGTATTIYHPSLIPDTVSISASSSGLLGNSVAVFTYQNPIDQMLLLGKMYTNRLDSLRLETMPSNPLVSIPYYAGAHREFMNTRVNVPSPTAIDTASFRRMIYADRLLNLAYHNNNSLEYDDFGHQVLGTLGVWDDMVGPLQAYQSIGRKTHREGYAILPGLSDPWRTLFMRYLDGFMEDFEGSLSDMQATSLGYGYYALGGINDDMPGLINARLSAGQPIEDVIGDLEIRSNAEDRAVGEYTLASQMTVDSIAYYTLNGQISGDPEAAAEAADSIAFVVKGMTDLAHGQILESGADSATQGYISYLNALPDSTDDRVQAIMDICDALLLDGSYAAVVVQGTQTADRIPQTLQDGAHLAFGDGLVMFGKGAQGGDIPLALSTNLPNAERMREYIEILDFTTGQYEVMIRSLQNALSSSDTAWMWANFQALLAANDSLKEGFDLAASPLVAAYSNAVRRIPGYAGMYSNAVDAVRLSARARALLEFRLVDYLLYADAGNGQALSFQTNEAISTTSEASRQIERLVGILFTTPASPLLVLGGINFPDSLISDSSYSFQVGVRNTGSGVAEDVSVILENPQYVTIVGVDSVYLGPLGSGQATTALFTITVSHLNPTDYRTGGLRLRIASPNAITRSRGFFFEVYGGAVAPGGIAGVVSDSATSAPISDAIVRVMSAGMEIASDTTDSVGSYSITGLVQGSYDVEALKDGYTTKMFAGISIIAGEIYSLNFSLPAVAGGCAYVPGDINGNGSPNGIDVTYGVSYLKGGSAPPDSCDCPPLVFPFYAAMDVNGNCAANGIDITYFVSYLKGQQPSLLFCADCPPAGMTSPPAPAVMPINIPSIEERETLRPSN